jgi:hypothetical protein
MRRRRSLKSRRGCFRRKWDEGEEEMDGEDEMDIGDE